MAGIVSKLFGKLSTDDEAATSARDNKDGGSDSIYKEDIELPVNARGKLAFFLHNVYTKKECQELIKATEKRGYEAALLNVGAGRQELVKDIRNSHRCMWESEEQARKLYAKIKPYLPSTFAGRTVVGLNERMRFLRYDPGEYFKPHFDGTFRRQNGDTSYITIQLYLNEGFKGGSTTFLRTEEKDEDAVECVPKIGGVLVFEHDILHEGSELIEGRKYTVRTDVMYTKT